jgi:general secretion pathway protein D
MTVGWAFTGHNAAAVVSALDKVTDLRLLQTPSVFVRNNAEATLNVGDKVPINTTTVTPAWAPAPTARCSTSTPA